MPYAIGLDIGTGSTKAVALSTEGSTIASTQVYYSNNSEKSSITEQDPEAIWHAFVECVQKIIKQLSEPPVAVGLSSYMHGLMAVDEKGHALTQLITWADTRAEAIATELKQMPEGADLYRTTGTPLHSMSPLCKIIWWKRNEPDLLHTAAKLISIKEYIWHKIFHSFQVDHSIGSATGLMDILSFCWNNPSLELCGITEEKLSGLVATGYIRKDLDPEVASMLMMPADTPFCIGGSDGCMANLGSGATRKGVAALTIGTSGAVRLVSSSPIYNDAAMIFNYVLEKGSYVCGGPVNNGGNVVQWLLKEILNKPLNDQAYTGLFNTIENVKAGSEGLLFLPYIYGERAPIWDERSSGAFIGIRQHHNQDHLMRAAIEGICFALNHVLQTIEQSAFPIDHLQVSGGLLHSRVWMQILADITGKKLFISHLEDASAIGAGMMALKHTGHISSFDIFRRDQDMVIQPQEAIHLHYRQIFSIFKELYKSLNISMHRLHYMQDQ